MAGSTFGNIFKITTWGESHGKGVGVVVDGCPAGLPLSEADIQVYRAEDHEHQPGGGNDRAEYRCARGERRKNEILQRRSGKYHAGTCNDQ